MRDRRRIMTPLMNRAPQYYQRILSLFGSSLIGYWPLWESSGTTAQDVSGNGRNGTYSGVTLGAAGIGDGKTCISINGTAGYCDVYSVSLRDAFNGALGTLICWAKVANSGVWTDDTTRRIAVMRADDSNRVIISKRNTDNALELSYIAGGSTNRIIIDPISSTGWIGWAIAWDKGNNIVRFYQNGVPLAPTVCDGVWAGAPISTTSIFGANATSNTNVWSGSLAHGILLNKAITDNEAAEIFF